MYSLTKATEILLHHYNLWNLNVSSDVLRYNTHKIRHSNWVLEIWRNLIIKINENKKISKETISRAEIAFLLHDIARFYQNDKHKILSNKEFEHWNERYKILMQEWYDEKIILAVKYHNKYKINWLYKEENYLKMNDNDKKETEFLSKLVRDTDKLQNMIYEVFNIEWLINFNKKLVSGNISEEIISDLKNEIPVDRENIKTYADEIIWTLSWIFDINFYESVDMLNYYWYFEKIINEVEKLDWVTKEKIEIVRKNILSYKL